MLYVFFLYLLQSSASFLVCNRQQIFLEGIKSNISTAVPQYPQGTGSRTATDTKICGCSSPLYKMAQCIDDADRAATILGNPRHACIP